MKVIVTGGNGKVGRYTVRDLVKAGHEVISMDLEKPDPRNAVDGVKYLPVELKENGEVADLFMDLRPEGVCHIAAWPNPSFGARSKIFANNVTSTYNVMQSAGDCGTRRFIYASSEMATGWLTTEELPPRFPFKEEDRVDSPNAYAMSKYMGEVIADSMAVRYPEMPICSLRINNVIMPDEYGILRERREQFPGPGSANYWSYNDVRDVARAFRAALEGQSSGHEVFLIAARDTCLDRPIREAVKIRYGAQGNFAGEHGPHDSCFDCSKIKQFFGWEAKYSWREQERAL